MFSLIVAMSENRVIGRNNQLPWHMPADLQHFKRITTGHWVIMGRKTYESMGKPLANRTNVVVTRRDEYRVPRGVLTAHNLDEAIDFAKEQNEVFILGGSEIFRAALPGADRMYLTLIHAKIEGDTVFPEFSEAEWALVREERHEADAKNPYPYSFKLYERKRS